MKKRNIMIGSAIVLAVLLVVGTMAWFTDSKAVTNTFQAGTVEIELDENNFENITNWNPGDTTTKDVDVIVKSTKQTYVRILLEPTWGDNDLELDFVKVKFTDPSKWADGEGNLLSTLVDNKDGLVPINELPTELYYTDIVKGNPDTTIDVIESVKFLGVSLLGEGVDQNEYQGETFELKVEAQAVQASHYAFRDEWNKDENVKIPAPGIEHFYEEDKPEQ